MKIITASNERYFSRIRPYLDSLVTHSQIPAALVCVGSSFMPACPVDAVLLPRHQNNGAPMETESPQHGAWLRVVPGEPDDIVIFTDGDILVQRPFMQAEIDWLSDIGEAVALGYNSGPAETLWTEAQRLFPRVTLNQLKYHMGAVDTIPCYNIGVIAAKRSTFQAIYDEYMPRWELISEAFGHAARQQWLVCWTIARLAIETRITSYSLHANGHYGIPPGCHYIDGMLYHEDTPVLFRHKL